MLVFSQKTGALKTILLDEIVQPYVCNFGLV